MLKILEPKKLSFKMNTLENQKYLKVKKKNTLGMLYPRMQNTRNVLFALFDPQTKHTHNVMESKYVFKR